MNSRVRSLHWAAAKEALARSSAVANVDDDEARDQRSFWINTAILHMKAVNLLDGLLAERSGVGYENR